MEVTIRINEEEIIDQVSTKVACLFEKKIKRWVVSQIRKRLNNTLSSKLEEILGEEIRQSLDEGFNTCDSWGTVKKETVKGIMRKEFAKEIEEARKALRSQVDNVVGAKLKETLKRSLGLD